MKTNKFKKHLELLGLRLAPLRSKRFAVQTVIGSRNIAYISEKTQYVFSTDTEYFHNNAFDNQETLYLLLKEYAETPLEEREEERRYVYELPVLDWSSERLCLYKTSHEYKKLRVTLREDLMDKELLYFTDKEVEQYTGKDRVLFNACEKIEVTSND